MNTKAKLNLAALTLGLTSMVSQIIIIRELVVVFYGNELSLGVILASWLFWTAIGSWAFGRLVDRIRFKETLLSAVQIATSIVLPLNILFIRIIKGLLGISAGEMLGFTPMLFTSFVSLSAICILLGFTFTLISKMASENSTMPSKAIGRIYLLEGLGASIGGLIYSFFLIKTLTPLDNAFVVGSSSIIASLFFNRNIVQLVYLIAISVAFIFHWPAQVDRLARTMQFRPFKMVESIDSIYGNIAVTKTGREYSFYENSLLMFTSGDALTSEESVHYAMLEHPSPKKVLLIGGGMGGALEQILKHPVEKVDYVELDPLIIGMAEKYLSPVKDRRLKILQADGRAFVKRSPESSYDIVILNLPDPYTAMLNRFYSLEFFREAKRLLSPDGLISFSLTSSENYINPENAAYLGCIYKTLEKEFDEIKIFPGDSVIFLASNNRGLLTYDTGILLRRLRERKIKTQFVREYYLPFKLNPLRIKYFEDTLKEYGSKNINTDFRPIGYFYHMLLWMTLFSAGRGMLPHMGAVNIHLLAAIMAGLFIIVFIIQRIKKSSFKTPVMISIGATGMSEISFQIIVILAFQFLYGYMYYRIGVILASFMIGLVLGSLFINRRLGNIKDERSVYIKIQGFISLYPLALLLIFMGMAKISVARPALGESLQLGFAFLPIIAGFLGGVQFPLANKICLKGSEEVGKTTGFLYGIDLFGACVGGLLVGLLLVPMLGIIETCVLLSIVNILVLILLFSARRSR